VDRVGSGGFVIEGAVELLEPRRQIAISHDALMP
jgi:hypothetical protein